MSTKIKKFALLTLIILGVGIVADVLFMTGKLGHIKTFNVVPDLRDLSNMSTSLLISVALSMAIILNTAIKLFQLLINLFKVLPYIKEKERTPVETNNALILFKKAAKNSKCFLTLALVVMKKIYLCFPTYVSSDSVLDVIQSNLKSASTHPMMILAILVAIGISIFYFVLKGMFNEAKEDIEAVKS